jgi:lipopolysaccharide transport system ATP-binding protein
VREYAIEILGVSKCYRIYDKPQDRLKESVISRLRRWSRAQPVQYFKEFWALRNVAVAVPKGETLGIIGRNGSGKSTLLQIVCGTLSPTAGEVRLNGRVAALLELGSGFNPEFTGRENIFLNGMVLGLTKEEVETRYDSIVAFADIGGFINQPVKTYSSGMAVRLAFAVIAHVDADILVIDEALAVGDAVFTQKCMRFLRRFRETGTVLFVSHDAASIVNLCSEAVWLDGGVVRMQGAAKDVAEAYARYCAQEAIGAAEVLAPLQEERPSANTAAVDSALDKETSFDFLTNIANSDGWASGKAEIVSVALQHASGSDGATFVGGESVQLCVQVATKETLESPIVGFLFKDKLGQCLFGHNTYRDDDDASIVLPSGGSATARFRFRLPLLPDGEYSITVSLADGDPTHHVQHHWMHDAVLVAVRSPKRRYGLVGIPAEGISFELL